MIRNWEIEKKVEAMNRKEENKYKLSIVSRVIRNKALDINNHMGGKWGVFGAQVSQNDIMKECTQE